ncbi:MAG: LysM peptidoglycan-binding domain-containing protein [Nitrospirota bacterium]
MAGVSMSRLTISIAFIIFSLCLPALCRADIKYKVKKGDNPHTLAKKFRVSAKAIIDANDIDPTKLKPGMKITIPSSKRDTERKSKFAKNPKHGKRDNGGKEQQSKRGTSADDRQRKDFECHIVKRGDTLGEIAKRYSIAVDEIKKINNLDSSRLKIGQKILLKRTDAKTYTVRKGDSLYRIAKRYDIRADELREINNLDTDALKPGQKLVLERETVPETARHYETLISQGEEEEPQIPKDLGESGDSQNPGITDSLVLFAKKLLDIPYRFGGNSILGIDCSAYVQRVYGLIGVSLPRSAREQFTEGNPVDRSELSIGDLVFFRTYASFPSHVGIYLGNNLFIHASSRSKKVTIDSLETPYYLKRYIGAKRVLGMKDGKENPEKEG